MKRIALAVFSLLCCLVSEQAFSQTSIPFRSPTSDSVSIVFIKKADSYRYVKVDSATEMIYLVGHVELQQDQTLIDCDSMVINQKENIIESFGNVHINDKDSLNIYSDYMKYFVDKKLVDFRKKVKLTDGKGVLTTEELHYDMNMRMGTYDNGGKVLNNGSVLTSQQGVYYADTKDVYFKKNVILRDPQYDLATDSLLYNTQTQISTFITWTDIVFRDSTHRSVRTREGFYDLRNKRAQFGKRATVVDGSQKVTADNIIADDSTGISIATGNAVYKDTAQGAVIIANRLESNKKKQTLLATLRPLMILKQDQDSIYIAADTLFSGLLSDWEKLQSTRPDLAVDQRISDSLAAKKTADSLLALANADTLLEGGHPRLDSTHINLSIADSSLAKRSGRDSLPANRQYTGPILEKPRGSNTSAAKSEQLYIDSLKAQAQLQIAKAAQVLPPGVTPLQARKLTDSIVSSRSVDSTVASKMIDSLSTRVSGRLRHPGRSDTLLALRTADSLLAIRKAGAVSARAEADTLLTHRIKDSLQAAKKAASYGLRGEEPDLSTDKDPKDSTLRFLQAYHHVRIYSDSLQAVCDSLWYSGKDSIFRLFTDPIAWGNGGYQVTGDTMFLFTKNKKADRLYVFENALAVNKAENPLYNQLKGITLNGFFKNGAIDYMRAKGNAESIYYTRDDNQALVGVNRATADIIDMIWAEKKLNKVVLRNDVTGTMYPIRRVNFEDMRLRNFKWLDEIRPKTKYELFEDPPSRRSRKMDDSFDITTPDTTHAATRTAQTGKTSNNPPTLSSSSANTPVPSSPAQTPIPTPALAPAPTGASGKTH